MLMNGLYYMPPAVTKLLLAELPVYATGSRYFGGATHESDWDFFTRASATALNVLTCMGYTKVAKDSNYTDTALIALYKHESSTALIQVQVVLDEIERNHCQEYLRSRFGSRMSEIPKDLRSELWDIALELVRLRG